VKNSVLVTILVFLVTATFGSRADNTFDWALLPSLTLTEQHTNGGLPDEGLDTRTEVDLVLSARTGQWLFFTEILVHHSTVDIERLKLGLEFTENDTIWLGRFHSHQGYWNSEFQHGAYVQASISRPLIERFGEHGGVLPDHFFGLVWERNVILGEAELWLELSMGQGLTQLEKNGLVTQDIGDNLDGSRDTFSLRLSYHPEAGVPNVIGLFAGVNKIPAVNLTFDEIDQTVLGLFGNWVAGNSRYIAAISHVNSEIVASPTVPASIMHNGYVQVEYMSGDEWTPYWRYEDMHFSKTDPYLSLLSARRDHQRVVGIRWDFTEQQALKTEFIHSELGADHFAEFMLQWSSALP
jgi:hypothetical protein